jgi:chromosome segregation ATPase
LKVHPRSWIEGWDLKTGERNPHVDDLLRLIRARIAFAMKNLEAEQQKMRERNRAAEQSKRVAASATSKETCEASELKALQKRVRALESENEELLIQIAALQRQAPAQQPSYEAERRKQQHDFFKYSNARRY